MNIEQQWDEMKKTGKTKYIIKRLRFGIGISVLIIILNLLLWGMNNRSYQDLILEFFVQLIVFVSISILGGYLSWSGIESKINIKKLEEEKLRVNIEFCYFCGNKLNEDNKVCPNCKKEIEK